MKCRRTTCSPAPSSLPPRIATFPQARFFWPWSIRASDRRAAGLRPRPATISSSLPTTACSRLIADDHPPKRVVELGERRYALPTISRTFEGRDRFAPAAAWLAKGVDLGALGRGAGALHRLDVPKPMVESGSGVVRGEVLRVDRFGNLITQHRSADVRRGDRAGRPRGRNPRRVSPGAEGRLHLRRRGSRRDLSRSSAAPTISRSPPMAPVPPRCSIWGAARPCASSFARDRLWL